MKEVYENLKATIATHLVLLAMKLDFHSFTRLAITCTAKVMVTDGASAMEVTKTKEGDGVNIRFVVRVGDQPEPKGASEWIDEWKNQANDAPTIH